MREFTIEEVTIFLVFPGILRGAVVNNVTIPLEDDMSTSYGFASDSCTQLQNIPLGNGCITMGIAHPSSL
jgi:hypothetical protein